MLSSMKNTLSILVTTRLAMVVLSGCGSFGIESSSSSNGTRNCQSDYPQGLDRCRWERFIPLLTICRAAGAAAVASRRADVREALVVAAAGRADRLLRQAYLVAGAIGAGHADIVARTANVALRCVGAAAERGAAGDRRDARATRGAGPGGRQLIADAPGSGTRRARRVGLTGAGVVAAAVRSTGDGALVLADPARVQNARRNGGARALLSEETARQAGAHAGSVAADAVGAKPALALVIA